MMTIEEMAINSGNMGWSLSPDGNRLYKYPLAWGKPYMVDNVWRVSCSNGVSEYSVLLSDLTIEWEG